ncbi:MAG: DNA recombination protein RmuC [Acidimicrobiia bacterium]|nr:DNA recombination protein RmuC [Acidimicrobiia bacterium]
MAANPGFAGVLFGERPKMSHPLPTMSGMDNLTVIIITALVSGLVVSIGFLLGGRRKGESVFKRDPGPPEEPSPADMLDPIIRLAGQTFQSHLQAGNAELARQREVFDTKWSPLVAGMNQELSDIRGLVTDLQKDRAVQHEGLTEKLRNAEEGQRNLLSSTQRLNDILGNSQARGQWGERMADDILRTVGMIEGVNYRKQMTTASGTRPDFSFELPDGRLLHMDVKFPLESYVRYLESENSSDQAVAAKDFGKALKGHILETAGRDSYQESISTVGFVLMFVSNESIYSFIHEHHGGLLELALSKGVVVCSPFTLFGMLSLVRQAMDTLALEKSSQEILDHLGTFSEEWARYVEKTEKVALHLGRLNKAFHDLTGTRQRKLERELDRIDELKTRHSGPSLSMVESPYVDHGEREGLALLG